MINKKTNYAHERPGSSGFFLPIVIFKESIFPENLVAELKEFVKRNALAVMNTEKNSPGVPQCCPHCLKAHVIKLAKDYNQNDEAIEEISNMFEGEIGHNGYYLDDGELCKV